MQDVYFKFTKKLFMNISVDYTGCGSFASDWRPFFTVVANAEQILTMLMTMITLDVM